MRKPSRLSGSKIKKAMCSVPIVSKYDGIPSEDKIWLEERKDEVQIIQLFKKETSYYKHSA